MKKKVLSIGLCIMFVTVGLVADEINSSVEINYKDGQVEDKSYRIKGISTAEDIGGVEASGNYGKLTFINYNSFAVTVIYEAVYGGEPHIGTVVLQKEETKTISASHGGHIISYTLIVRKLSK